MSDFDPQLLKGVLTPLLLALLAEHDDYGYSLVERLREGGLGDVAEGTVYPALARAERAGFVEAYQVPSDRGPARKYYRLSDVGRGELHVRVAAWHDLERVVAHLTKGLRP
ncbi:MAG: PadR family transcriptional regulator [Desertimonas sp.]